MLIAIDIDNTLVSNKSRLYGFLNKNHSFLKFRGKQGIKLTQEKLPPTFLNKFFPVLNPKYYNSMENSVESVNSLSSKNEVILLSSRPYNFKAIRYLTLKAVNDSGLKVSGIFLNCKHKWAFCKENNVDILIDNSEKQCSEVSTKSNTKCICFDNTKPCNITSKMVYLKDWKSIGDYITYIQPILNSEKQNYISNSFVQSLKDKFAENYKDKIFDSSSLESPHKSQIFPLER